MESDLQKVAIVRSLLAATQTLLVPHSGKLGFIFWSMPFWSLKTVDLATIFGKHKQNWQVLVFLPLLCFVFWLWCCICDKFYIANHAVLVPHFTPAKSRSCHKTLFLQVWPGEVKTSKKNSATLRVEGRAEGYKVPC